MDLFEDCFQYLAVRVTNHIELSELNRGEFDYFAFLVLSYYVCFYFEIHSTIDHGTATMIYSEAVSKCTSWCDQPYRAE